MEDFNNKFSKDNASKNYNKYFAIAMFFAIFIILFCIINILKKKSANNNLSEAILLIEAENQEISRKPKDVGGLSVENLDINVYDALDKNDNNDMNALEETELLWGERRTCTFLRDMIQTAEVPEKEENVENEHYLVLTKQNNNFDKLNPNDILGTDHSVLQEAEPMSGHSKWNNIKRKSFK